ncbi:MAG: CHAT domain-containing protein, partial [Geminicoccaceae bacterium]
SPITRILNRPDIITKADLSVIAGDIEGKGVFHRLGVFLTDLYYPGDHDLIVDTASMYGGLKRLPGRSRRYFEDGPDVYHFRYFKNESSASQVWSGLSYESASPGEPPVEVPGFSPIVVSEELEDLRSRSGEPRPTVFILPGILGSELRYDDKRIWMSLRQIFKGRLERLDLHRENPKEIEAFRMFPRYYFGLAKYLAASHNIEPFPYDWRISMQTEAKRFAALLTKELDGNTQPVRILAHSMGGLVARLAFALDHDLWRKFKAKEGSRLVMLGTPNRGSFSIARMLMGKEKTTGLLALLDTKHGEKELLNFIRRFLGVLELLPADSHHNFFDERVWNRMDEVDGKGWQEPFAEDLKKAEETWRLLDNAPIDNNTMIYVAGQADATPVDMSIDDRKVRFRATGQGDGRVPWDTGIPAGLPAFYVNASHGDLPRHEQAFSGYLDLLQQGITRQLSDKKPALRGAAMPFALPDDPKPIYPDQEALEAAVLGAKTRYTAPMAKAKPIQVQIHLGDLAFSRFPVMVGHYEQDSLNGTERCLDNALKGRLSARRERGLYPGRVNSAEVILDDGTLPPGAVVIGLGEVGGLSVGKLKRALLHGLRRYILTKDEEQEHQQKKDKRYGLTTLIIGSGEDAMSAEDALAALLDAILDLQRSDQLGGLAQIDIIELYEHRAIEAMRALAKLHKQPRYDGHLEIMLDLKEVEGGIRKVVLEKPSDWAQRIQIQEMEIAGGRYRGLQYAVLTGRARIEDIAVPDTLKLADAFIKAAIEQTRFDGRSSPGRTLFELLLPRRLKLVSDEDRDLVLMLDQFAAGYPWELMEDPVGDDERPPAIRAGLIRQLHDQSFRPDVLTTSQRSALVVGDPAPRRADPRFPALNGAVDEARTVAGLISRAGYAVTQEIRTLPASVIATFMNQPYRIMHLAGHGVFEEPLDETSPDKSDDDKPGKPRLETGMILGDGLFLTPGAVRQLTNVPELVFLNCCYLGRIDVSAERRTTTLFHELAANLATQFIRIGAKAVIAAGWAVDDAAANTFAATFYQAMLQGEATFNDAVKQARRQTYLAHPYTNSWGAYQAYGDPAFTLNGKKSGNGGAAAKWYHPYEAELAFNELTQRAQTAARTDPADLRREFARHWQSTHETWRNQSAILAAKARAAGELHLLSKAIEAYNQAIIAEKSDAPVKAIEQRANLRARYAVHLAKGKAEPEKTPSAEPLDMIIESWRDLEGLDDLQAKTEGSLPNVERLNLFGSAAKRASQLYVRSDKTAVDLLRESKQQNDQKVVAERYSNERPDRTSFPDEQIEWLKRSATFYKRAHDESPKKSYALTNWLTMCALIRLRAGKLDKGFQPHSYVEQERLLTDADLAEQTADLEQPGFWALAPKGDIALTRLLIEAVERLPKPNEEKAAEKYEEAFRSLVNGHTDIITRHYVKAWKRGGSVLKISSVLEQLNFITDALSIGPSKNRFERQCLASAIRHVEEEIDQVINAND